MCTKGGNTSSGTLHLTAHHAIFHYEEEGKEEMWVSPKTYLPTHSLTTIVLFYHSCHGVGSVPTHLTGFANAHDASRSVSTHNTHKDIRNDVPVICDGEGCD